MWTLLMQAKSQRRVEFAQTLRALNIQFHGCGAAHYRTSVLITDVILTMPKSSSQSASISFFKISVRAAGGQRRSSVAVHFVCNAQSYSIAYHQPAASPSDRGASAGGSSSRTRRNQRSCGRRVWRITSPMPRHATQLPFWPDCSDHKRHSVGGVSQGSEHARLTHPEVAATQAERFTGMTMLPTCLGSCG